MESTDYSSQAPVGSLGTARRGVNREKHGRTVPSNPDLSRRGPDEGHGRSQIVSEELFDHWLS